MNCLAFGALFMLCITGALQTAVRLDSYNIPAFLWSGKSYFSGQNVEVLETVSPSDIQNTLSAITQNVPQQTSLTNYISSQASKPEIVLVYVVSQMRTDQITQFGKNGGAFSQVKQAVETSASSLVVPYVASTEAVSFIDGLVHDFGKDTKVIVAKSQDSEFISSPRAQDVDIADLENYLKSHTELFNNGKTDVVVVYFDISYPASDFAKADQVIGKVRAVAEKESNGNFVAVFTANKPDGSHVQKVFGTQHNRIKARDFNDPGSWWPYLIWDVIVGVIPLLIILWVAIYCLCLLQTPTKFEGGTRGNTGKNL